MENKKVLGSFFVLVLSLFTFGCRSQNVEISSKDSSLSLLLVSLQRMNHLRKIIKNSTSQFLIITKKFFLHRRM